jgi:uncharacterized protein (TIGR02391 family)
MDKSKAIELLRQALNEIPHLKELRYDDQEFTLWFDKVRDIIQAGLDEVDRQRFPSSRKVTITTSGDLPSDDDLQNLYLIMLNNCETALKSIIQKCEVVGLEGEPTIAAEPPSKTAEVPNYLFNEMQFHPRIITASKSLFESGHYAQAIFEAFKAVENFVKDKSGLALYGTNLMERVFNEENPIIKVPEAGHYYKDVQKGFKHLFIGASQGIRNPKAHKEIIQKDPYITLQYLGFFSFLLKRIDYWETGVS